MKFVEKVRLKYEEKEKEITDVLLLLEVRVENLHNVHFDWSELTRL